MFNRIHSATPTSTTLNRNGSRQPQDKKASLLSVLLNTSMMPVVSTSATP